MKMFTKLVLVSSMAISANAMAMQSMDDAALSAATGQDGINIGIALDSTGISIDKLYLHDNDGLQTSTGITGATGVAGAIAIDGITITQTGTGNLLDLLIDTDAGTSGEAFLNIAASVGAVDISIGSIGVAPSNGASLTDTTTAVRGVTGTPTEILTGLDLSLGAISANVQLGATPQGAMIKLDSTLEGGLTISNLGINDAAGGGQIYLDNIYVRGDNATGDLDIDTDISVTNAGLRIQNNSTQNMNVYIAGVRLGASATGATNASIGDIEIQGLNVGTSTITISGY
ncbi:protein FilA [Acinetobacter haemolyticus]|uniref:putative pilus system protein FilA n=1 Tax=Acinetobacter haemolyticus TaxID=29430 RepID=UPI001372FC39|nr:DUF6160 family protein [Acinetobacter haemolyticus]NAR29714.1 protein FilA [Acinetobacter haemolyticus]NAR36411.1 protein FilA [Acinetobacter haemolyticus]NAR48883.1 protein FilA [Acinetobacter haemolyticus]